jgi:hypothetical protein
MKTIIASKFSASYMRMFFLPLLCGTLLFFSCNQDDVFYQIENETELRNPLIEGGPSKIVEFGGALYVASGSIWAYKDGGWSKISNQPVGTKVLDIAATGKYLYAVTSTGVNLGDSRYYRGTAAGGEIAWDDVIARPPSHPYPNTVYGTEDALFVGAATQSSNYAAYALLDGEREFRLIREQTSSGAGRLLGAAKWDNRYFISLESQGVFAGADLDALTLVTDSAGKGNFTGFIEVDGSLLMAASNGFICKLSPGESAVTESNSRSLGFTFTGAIAVWNDPDDDTSRYLLLGRKGSNSNYSGYGYLEWDIPPPFDIKATGPVEPQATVSSNAAYKNSLGKRAINSIYQTPKDVDEKMPIFASTQGYNLWACRDRIWNYE